jgi:hypothetical protein
LKRSRQPVFLDTSFVIAIDNHDDPHHAKAEAIAQALRNQRRLVFLHWGILLEIGDGYGRLKRRERGMKLLNMFTTLEEYRVVSITKSLMNGALRLFHSRPDKEWGLTDCVSFALMEREGIKEALTADPHFRQAGFVPLLLGEEHA